MLRRDMARRVTLSMEYLSCVLFVRSPLCFSSFLVLFVAACALSQAQPDLTPPPQKPLDAKTQLETGRKY
jgi:hypothetical protein